MDKVGFTVHAALTKDEIVDDAEGDVPSITLFDIAWPWIFAVSPRWV